MFLVPVTVKYMEENLDVKKPPYIEHILPVPRSLVISTFHCNMKFLPGERGSIPLFGLDRVCAADQGIQLDYLESLTLRMCFWT